MADPRNTISFEGIGEERVTYLIDDDTITYDATKTNGSAQVGLAVTLSAARTVALVADAEAVIGKLLRVEADDKAVVQVGGYMTLPGGTSATLTLGTPIVGNLLDTAKGYIRSAASVAAAELLVAKGAIMDASVTTAVVVKF